MRSLNTHRPVPNPIDSYYQSIVGLFAKTLEVEEEDDWWLFETASFITGLCAIPVIPAGLWALSRFTHLLHGLTKHHFLQNRGFGFWWMVSVTVSIAVLVLVSRLNSSREKSRKKGVLKGARLRFAFCCALIDDLKKYRETQLEEHYTNVPKYWTRLSSSLESFLNPSGHFPLLLTENYVVRSRTLDDQKQELLRAGLLYPSGAVRQKEYSYFPQIDRLRLTCPWFSLSEQTERIVRGFDYLPDKLGTRIIARKDLRDVTAILEDLAGYLYSTIPSLPTDEDTESDRIRSNGLEALSSFADKMIAIADFQPEQTVLRARPISFGERVIYCLNVAGGRSRHLTSFFDS